MVTPKQPSRKRCLVGSPEFAMDLAGFSSEHVSNPEIMLKNLENQLMSLPPSDDPAIQSAYWYTCYCTLSALFKNESTQKPVVDHDERDRECTLVAIGIPESSAAKPSQCNRDDFNQCIDLLDQAGIESSLIGKAESL